PQSSGSRRWRLCHCHSRGRTGHSEVDRELKTVGNGTEERRECAWMFLCCVYKCGWSGECVCVCVCVYACVCIGEWCVLGNGGHVWVWVCVCVCVCVCVIYNKHLPD